MDTIVVRSLTREYHIQTSSPELTMLVRFIEAKPEIAESTLLPMTIAVTPASVGFEVDLPAGKIRVHSVPEAANHIHAAIFAGIQEEAVGAPLVHCASVVRHGQRMIVVGAKGAGKSTLTLHLLARGFAVEGDEHVILREDELVARPRRMRVKPGSLPLVPSLASAVLRSPKLTTPEGCVYALDPSVAGRPWRIAPGQADRLIFIEPNHGGPSRLSCLGTHDAFGLLAQHCLLPDTRQAAAAARLRRLAFEVPSYRLCLGDLEQAEAALGLCVAQ